VVGDATLFRWLERAAEPLLARDPAAVEHAIASSLRIKGRVVRRDERDEGRRAVLNFGHTIAHALETASSFRMRHGHAVAIGCSRRRASRSRSAASPREIGIACGVS